MSDTVQLPREAYRKLLSALDRLERELRRLRSLSQSVNDEASNHALGY